MKAVTIIAFFFAVLPQIVCGQNEITIEDYNRAVGFRYENYNGKKAFNLHIHPNWFADSTGVWFVHQAPKNKSYVKVSFPDQVRSDLFDHKKLAAILSDSLKRNVEAGDLPISDIEYNSPQELLITVEGDQFIWNTGTNTASEPAKEEQPTENEMRSPDKKWIAYSKDYNLFVKAVETNEMKQLSTDGEKGYEHGSWYGWGDIIEGENGERPKNFDVEWSENSEWIFGNICNLRTANKMHLLNWSIDTLYRPMLLSYYRGSPGDTNMVYQEPVFFNIKTGKEVRPDLPRSTHINPINVTWSDTPNIVYLEQLDRGYQKITFYSFDLETEQLDTLYSETSGTNIDNFDYDGSDKSNLMFFLSEKSGWRQLYSIDLKTSKEKAITKGDYYIHNIEKIDEENKIIYFTAAGKEKGLNPYYRSLYSVSFSGKNLTLLTKEPVNHTVYISPDGKYFVDNYSTINTPTTTVLRSAATGETLLELGKADVSRFKGWSPPEVFTALARDEKTTIYGAIYKPTNFDSTAHYPVIEASYTGPHTQVFPREFIRAFQFQSYAELGFIVVVIDGLGSSGRSKAFHNYSYKNLGGNLEDHVRAIKQLGRRHSWVDTTRVGIFGHSAGGYDAGHAVLEYPDFYKVAVASSGDHDHRMEKASWPEMYMGWPVDSAYHLQSNITMAGNLKGKLLLVHGGIDENVNPSATFKFADALIKADKQFDMLILPSQRHGYRGSYAKYFAKVRWNYFIEHLRGAEPLWDFEWE
jgi:dipeptidyl-peptidase-4